MENTPGTKKIFHYFLYIDSTESQNHLIRVSEKKSVIKNLKFFL